MRYSYSILLCLAVSFPVSAQSILRSGLHDLDIAEPLDYRVSSEYEIKFPVDYSWLVRDNWLLKCRFQSFAMKGIAHGDSDYRIQQGNFFSQYYFPGGGSTAAYLGVEAGWRRTKYGSVRESGLVIGSSLGIKYFFNNSISIDTSISYKLSTDDVFIIDHNTTDRFLFRGIEFKASFQ